MLDNVTTEGSGEEFPQSPRKASRERVALQRTSIRRICLGSSFVLTDDSLENRVNAMRKFVQLYNFKLHCQWRTLHVSVYWFQEGKVLALGLCYDQIQGDKLFLCTFYRYPTPLNFCFCHCSYMYNGSLVTRKKDRNSTLNRDTSWYRQIEAILAFPRSCILFLSFRTSIPSRASKSYHCLCITEFLQPYC